jgi:acyl carrier protein
MSCSPPNSLLSAFKYAGYAQPCLTLVKKGERRVGYFKSMDFNASQKPVDATSRARNLVAIVTDLVRELRGSRASVNVTLSSRLDRDLGIDSLGRTELVLRIERLFRIRLPVTIIGEADTVQDILTALERAAVQQGTPDFRDVIAAEAPIAAQPVVAAAEAKTLEALEWHVARNPDRVHVIVLHDESTVLVTMTYGELAQAARAVAAGLIVRDVAPLDRVALMLPTGTEFFAAFLGTLYAGAVPVPIYPPMQLSQLEEYLRRQTKILRNAESKGTRHRARGAAAWRAAAWTGPLVEGHRERQQFGIGANGDSSASA